MATQDENLSMPPPSKDLKSSRVGQKGYLTKLCHEGETLMINRSDVNTINQFKIKFSEACTRFEKVHHEYMESGIEEEEKTKLEESFRSHSTNVQEFYDRIENYITNLQETRSIDRESAVSQSSSTKLKEALVKEALLKLKQQQLADQQRIEREKLELDQKASSLRLQNEADQARLEAEVWEQLDAEEAKSNTSAIVSKVVQERVSLSKAASNHSEVNPGPTQTLRMDAPSFFPRDEPTGSSPSRPLPHAALTVPPRGNPYSPADVHVHTKPVARSQDVYGAGHGDMQAVQAALKNMSLISESMTLPKPELLTFSGKSRDFFKFVRNFQTNIVSRVSDPSLRLSYLIQFCEGEAKRLIEDCVLLSPQEGYQKAMNLLESRYGKPHVIARSFIDGLLSGPSIGVNDVQALVNLSNEMAKCEMTLKEMGYMSDINSSGTVSGIVKRLPNHIRSKWVERAHGLIEMDIEPDFSHLCQFIENRAKVASTMYGVDFANDSKASNQRQKVKGFDRKVKASTFSTFSNKPSAGVGKGNGSQCCKCCKENHLLIDCQVFAKMPVKERCEFVKSNKLCFNCLHSNHMVKGCVKGPQCITCGRKHHELLHLPEYRSQRVNRENKCDAVNATKSEASIVTCTSLPNESVSLRIVPVTVKGRGNMSVETYALLDNGSDVSLCDERLLSQLGIKGRSKTFNITTVNQQSVVRHGREVDISVYPLGGDDEVKLNRVWSVDKLPVSTSSLPESGIADKWPHLNGLKFPRINSTDVMLLIGSDTPEVFWTLDERRGKPKEPYAVKSILGWTLLGPTGVCKQTGKHVNFQRADPLDKQVEMMWKTDFSDSIVDWKNGMSVEDKRAHEVMKNSVSLQDGNYTISIPWKNDPSQLPNNLKMAEVRLSYLKKKLRKDQELHDGYVKSMQDYISKGYARKVTKEEVEDKDSGIWYIPHHPVVNPNKPGKVRIVFDCAAKYKGTCLNDSILQGPDLVNLLVGVLTRFREEEVAIVADIEAMFHQVKIPKPDQKFLLFLWWEDGRLDAQPDVYCMTRHIFGATSSPSCAAFALKKTADDNGTLFNEETIRTVHRNFYVDDLLKSCKTVQDATQLAVRLKSLLQKGGFRLTKWASSNREFLSSIPADDRAPSMKDLKFEEDLPVERALGMKWNVETDSFTYYIKSFNKPLTRRGILSMTSSLYDPLGLVSPVSLIPKLIMQNLCRLKYDWDDEVPETISQKWTQWAQKLDCLANLKIKRCIKPDGLAEEYVAELHHFADASEYAYGAASYLKIYDIHGNSACSLLMGKSRLAPIKPLTIPRLELSAAVVAVRLHQMIMSETDIKIDSAHFWTDSVSTLMYIRNTTKRFKTFVANRLSVIHEITDPSDWKYVPSEINPADMASRGLFPDEHDRLQRWLAGPEFLYKGCSYLEGSQDFSSEDVHLEIKESAVINTTQGQVNQEDAISKMIARFGTWFKLKKAVAWLLRFKDFLKKRTFGGVQDRTNHLTLSELSTAEKEIIRFVQRDEYRKEVTALQNLESIPKSSAIKKLSPVMKEDMIVVGGRLQHSELGEQLKHPWILPSKHHVTDVIIRECHHMNGHAGPQHTLSLLRQKYWIVQGLSAVKRITTRCIQCKRYTQPLEHQQMSTLPKERVTPNKSPFSTVGIDYFGPLLIKQRRSQVKRYGCLFTCFTTRAVHIEIAHTLTTDSFLAAFCRFMSRRGKPEVVYSDNGTNLTSGEKELRENIRSWNQGQIEKYFHQREIQWHFIPPLSSHMGGVWERMVRSIKNVLRALLKQQIVNDEVLLTVMCEAEKIVNDRPITPVSDDPKDPRPLTPNMLLLLESNSCLPPGIFSKDEIYSRRWWRQAQYLANLFWKRWIKEYLPLLQPRSKWSTARRNVKVGDLVLVHVAEENCSRGNWPLGVVLEVNEGRDGLVRSAKVKVGSSIKVRPIVKLCLLEASTSE